MPKRVFLIHGWGGSPQEGWRPWLKQELEERGFEVYIPAMPDTNFPKLAAWLGQLAKAIGAPDTDCYLVGHSLGCITILRYLEALKENEEIGGAVLVAGFTDIEITVGEDESINEINSFFETEVDFDKIKSHCKKFVAIHSDDDPYVPLRYADIFRGKLAAGVIVERNMKHFSGDDGIDNLPSALEALLRISR